MSLCICILLLGNPLPGAQTPGEEDHAWVVVEGPRMGIYQDKKTMQEAIQIQPLDPDFKNIGAEKQFPYRGGRFMTLEAAKNWVQAAIVVKIGVAPAPYGRFWMCF